MRSSYSMPSAFISATASPRALLRLRHQHRERVVEDRLDDREHVERVGLGLGVEQVERDERERRQRLVEREVVLQRRRPAAACGRRRRARAATPARRRRPARRRAPRPARTGAGARARPRGCPPSARASSRPGPRGWLTTLRIIAWSTRIRETSGSGAASRRRSNVSSVQPPRRPRGFLRWTLRRFFGSSPALASARVARSRARAPARRRSPDVSNPARPARPAIWWNSRAFSSRWRVPSNFARPVKTTVRIGTLMPTPSVSVPQITFSSPVCASCSTSRR